MKSSEFGSALRTYAAALTKAGAGDAGQKLALFASVFPAQSRETVANVIKRLSISMPHQSSGGSNLGEVASLISGWRSVLADVSKAGILADIDAINRLLLASRSGDLDDLIKAAAGSLPTTKTKPVPKAKSKKDVGLSPSLYLERLTATLGDDAQFASIFSQLSSDRSLSKDDVVRMAKTFTGNSAKSKKDALKAIENRHRALVESQDRNKATSGRTAA